MENIEAITQRLEPLQGNIIFQFLDEISGTKREFRARSTLGGISLVTYQNEQKQPRWGVVVAVSEESDLKPGDYILIQGLMWSNGTTFSGVDVWKTDEHQVLMYTQDVTETYCEIG